MEDSDQRESPVDNSANPFSIEGLPEIIDAVRSLRAWQPVLSAAACNTTDSYGRILLVFAARFFGHTDSLLNLDASKDCLLIARSMIEGFVILLWVTEDADKCQSRAEAYFHLGPIEEYVHLHRLHNDLGISLDSFTYIRTKQILSSVMARLPLNEKEREAIQRDQPIEHKHFIERLTGLSIKALFKKYLPLENPKRPEYYYVLFFNVLSDYHHWNSRVMPSLVTENELLHYCQEDEEYFALALEIAFRALHRVLFLANQHFELGRGLELEAAWEAYINGWMLNVRIPNP
jgi:hypothetical protein